MAEGIKVFNPDGSLQLDIASRTFRILTVVDVGSTSSGNVLANVAQGTPIVGMELGEGYIAPTVTTTGTGASWDYGSIPVGQRDPNFRLTLAVF